MSLSTDSLKGKVCVVTGAAKSIGLGIATKYAEQGAKVALIDIDPLVEKSAAELVTKGLAAKSYILNITDRDAVLACFEQIVNDLGDIYALVNNAGVVEPIQAAELAETLGIKVYTIGVGTKGEAPVPVTDPFSGKQVVQWMPVNIDEETLQKVADLTHGKYFRATDTDSLQNIYEEIDALEKTKVEAQHYTDYRELAVQPYRAGLINVPPLLLVAFGLLLARFVLEQTWLRELN